VKKVLTILMMGVMLWGCSEESEQKNSVPENPLRLSGVTRAPSDVTAATDSLSPIQIFLMSGLEKAEGNFVYNTTRGEWISTIGVKELENYVFGFAPATAAKGQVRTVTSGATDYSEGCVMTLDELMAIGGEDLCVVTGVKADKTPITEVPEFGTFKFDKQGTTNYIGLLLDHLYGAIEFKIKVGARYSERRDIWLKKMALTSTQAVTQATVTLKANTTGGNPITDVRYTTAEGEQTNTCYDYGTDPTTTKGLLLTTEGTRFTSYCAPIAGLDKKLRLVCTYDVYNKKGTRVRENCTAENSLAGISEVTIGRGKKVIVNLTVEPTYLYQLSEDELDNPGVKIKSE